MLVLRLKEETPLDNYLVKYMDIYIILEGVEIDDYWNWFRSCGNGQN